MFGTGNSLGSNTVSLSYITGVPDINGIRDPVVLVIFKSIQKRDPTTKERGLSELLEALKSGKLSNGSEIDIYDENFQKSWVMLYGKLSIDVSKSVAMLAHQCNGLFFKKLDDKHTALRLLKSVIGPWILGLYDTTLAVSNAAKEALEFVFVTHEKRVNLYKVFEVQLLDLIYDVIEIESAISLSDQRFVSKEEAETKYQNVVHNALKALRVLILTQDTENGNSYNRFFGTSSCKFWKLLYSKNSTVAKAALQVLDGIISKKSQWIPSYMVQIKSALVKSLSDKHLFATVTVVISHLFPLVADSDSFWTPKDLEKWSKCIISVFSSGGKTGLSFWNSILPLLDVLPKELSLKSDYADKYVSSLIVSANREVVARSRVIAWNTIITAAEHTGNDDIAVEVISNILKLEVRLDGVSVRPLLEHQKVQDKIIESAKTMNETSCENLFALVKNNGTILDKIMDQACTDSNNGLAVAYHFSVLGIDSEVLRSFITTRLHDHIDDKLWSEVVTRYFAYGSKDAIQTCFEKTLAAGLSDERATVLFNAARSLKETEAVEDFVNRNLHNDLPQKLDLVTAVLISSGTPEPLKKRLVTKVEESFLSGDISDQPFVRTYVRLQKEAPNLLRDYDIPSVKTALWKLLDGGDEYPGLESALTTQKHSAESLVAELNALTEISAIDNVIYQSKLAVESDQIEIGKLLFISEWPSLERSAYVPYEVSTQNTLGGAVFLVENGSEQEWRQRSNWIQVHSLYAGSLICEVPEKFLADVSLSDKVSLVSYLLVVSEIFTTYCDYTSEDDLSRAEYEHVMTLYDDIVSVMKRGDLEDKVIAYLELKCDDLSPFAYYGSRVLLRLYDSIPSNNVAKSNKVTMMNFAKALSQSNSTLINQTGSSFIRMPPEELAHNLGLLVLLNLMLERDLEYEKTTDTIPPNRIVMILESLFNWTSSYNDNEAIRTEITKILVWVVSSYYDSGSLPGSVWESIFEVVEQNSTMVESKPALTRATLKLLFKLLQKRDFLKGAWNNDIVYNGAMEIIQSLEESDTPSYVFVCQQLRQVCRIIPPGKVQIPYSYLGNSNIEFVTACYELFHKYIPLEQEDKSVELALGGNFEIPLELISLVLEPNDTGSLDSKYLMGWELIYDHFVNASYELRRRYIGQLREGEYLQVLLDYMGPYLTETSVEDPDLVLLHRVYYTALLFTGSLVKSWFLNLRRSQVSISVERYTEKYVSPVLIRKELIHVESWLAKNELSNLKVRVSQEQKEIHASYTIDDQTMEIVIELPSLYPLRDIQVKSQKRVGIKEKQWRAWMLACQAIGTSQNGSVVDTLELFNKNITLHFQNVEACAICYSIIHQDMTLPNKTCGTCKNKFHVDCLWKWFKSAGASECPLCRSTFVFRPGQ